MKVELVKYPTDEDWKFVKDCTLVTIGKTSVNPPDLQWKRAILKARHSPIRELRFAFLLVDIPYWVSTHLVRHIHAQPYVKSQRNDRQKQYDRNKASQDTPVNMMWTMGAEELMIIANKRLCNLAAEGTREVVKRMCQLVEEKCPEFVDLLVPMCVWQGGICHEMFPCNK